jgi:hypothetical protein
MKMKPSIVISMRLPSESGKRLQVVADILDAKYFAGSYAYHSRFTSLLQRPMGGAIRGQIEIEAVEVHIQVLYGNR